MRYKIRLTAAFIISTMAVSVPAFAASHTGQKRHHSRADISLKKAEHIALQHAYSGKIISKELEKEQGGSGLRYSFDIRNGNSVHEVGVDAKTGKILENSVENDEHGEGYEDNDQDSN